MFTEDSTQYWSGIYYTLNLSLTIGPVSEEDQVDLFLSQKNLTYQIFLHDPGFFILSDNPIAFPMEARVFKTGGMSSGHIYRLNLIQMNELNVPSDPCNEDPKFNFRTCVKGSIAEKVFSSSVCNSSNYSCFLKVGCSTKWDPPSKSPCTSSRQFRWNIHSNKLLLKLALSESVKDGTTK